jgi:alcohol dehydrogenase class IV
MTLRFEFSTAGRILFGSGVIAELPEIAAKFGARPVIVCGRGGANPGSLIERLEARQLTCSVYAIENEPTIETVRSGREEAALHGCDLVIAFGGGSVIDAGKAIAAMLTNPGDVLDYLEVIGAGKTIPASPIPMIAAPTTAGTGAEVTRNAVISSPEHHFKASMRSPMLIPRVALVDPDLTFSMPPAVTASTGMDALTQLIEPFVSIRANPITDGFCREGIEFAARSLRQAYQNGADPLARESMSAASLLGGLALANAGLGAVHGFASPIGGFYPAPHGAVCARLLAPVVAANIQALQQRADGAPALERYREISRILTGNPAAEISAGAAWLAALTEDLHIPRLSAYGIKRQDVPDLVERASQASSMKANPIVLTKIELTEVLIAGL